MDRDNTFVFKKLKIKDLGDICTKAVLSSAMLFIIIGMVNILAGLLNRNVIKEYSYKII